jgi:hypothetical protein
VSTRAVLDLQESVKSLTPAGNRTQIPCGLSCTNVEDYLILMLGRIKRQDNRNLHFKQLHYMDFTL